MTTRISNGGLLGLQTSGDIKPGAYSARAPSANHRPPRSCAVATAGGDSRGRDHNTTFASTAVAPKPSVPTGFDWVSAAIGAVVVAGLSLVSVAAFSMRRRTGRHDANA